MKKLSTFTIIFFTSILTAQPPGNQQTGGQQQKPSRRQTQQGQLQNRNQNQPTRTLTHQRDDQSQNNQEHNQRSQSNRPIINHHHHNNNYISVNLPSITNSAVSAPESTMTNNSNTTSSSDTDVQNENNNTAKSTSMAVMLIDLNSVKEFKDGVTDFFARNKKQFFLGGIAGLYGTIFYHVTQGNYYLKNGLRWSVWHKEISLKQLRKASYAKLTAELVCSVQRRCLSPNDPINFSAPIGTFMQELEKEEKQLRFYQKLYHWCSRLWIRRLFPFNVKLYKKIGIRLRRIRFLRRRFIKWVTKYKMEQNKTFERAVKSLRTKPLNI